jgi:BCD family chlorophyll transporter-like MFS transporter
MNNLQTEKIPHVNMLTIFRLSLFNLGVGLMAVLTLAVLNRVMISELNIPATVAAGTLAVAQLIAPARIWFGQLSDAKPIFGLHRTGYVRLGVLVFGVTVFLIVQTVWQIGILTETLNGWIWNSQIIGWTAILALLCAIYGLGISASSTPFTALLVDISEEDNRSKIVAVVWSMLMVGIVMGGITGKILLDDLYVSGLEQLPESLAIYKIPLANVLEEAYRQGVYKIPLEFLQKPINSIFLIVPTIVIILTMIATWRIEKKYSRYSSRSTIAEREDSVTLGAAWKILTASRQTGIFFTFLVLVTMGLFLQEAVLEPYGGDIFNMAIGETTMLNSYWGIGILIGYSSTGFLVIPRLGKTKTTQIGCVLVAICFALIILAGFTQNPAILKGAMILFGIAAGVTTVGSISLMLDLTAAETAGTFIGAWGLAQAMSRGLATWFGGIILDIGRSFIPNLFLAYSLVFALEVTVMLLAIYILNHVSVKEFKNTTRQAITQVMEGELDG